MERCSHEAVRSACRGDVPARWEKKSQAHGIFERQRLGTSFQIIVPGTAASRRARLDVFGLKKILDGLPTDLGDTQPAEFFEDLGVARAVLGLKPKKGDGSNFQVMLAKLVKH